VIDACGGDSPRGGAALAGRRLIPSLGLLWINLLTDTLSGLALALEPVDAGLIERPPARSPARAT